MLLHVLPDTMCDIDMSPALIHFLIKRGLLLYLTCGLLKSDCFLVSFSLSGSSIMLLLSKSSQPLTTLLQKLDWIAATSSTSFELREALVKYVRLTMLLQRRLTIYFAVCRVFYYHHTTTFEPFYLESDLLIYYADCTKPFRLKFPCI